MRSVIEIKMRGQQTLQLWGIRIEPCCSPCSTSTCTAACSTRFPARACRLPAPFRALSRARSVARALPLSRALPPPPSPSQALARAGAHPPSALIGCSLPLRASWPRAQSPFPFRLRSHPPAPAPVCCSLARTRARAPCLSLAFSPSVSVTHSLARSQFGHTPLRSTLFLAEHTLDFRRYAVLMGVANLLQDHGGFEWTPGTVGFQETVQTTGEGGGVVPVWRPPEAARRCHSSGIG